MLLLSVMIVISIVHTDYWCRFTWLVQPGVRLGNLVQAQISPPLYGWFSRDGNLVQVLLLYILSSWFSYCIGLGTWFRFCAGSVVLVFYIGWTSAPALFQLGYCQQALQGCLQLVQLGSQGSQTVGRLSGRYWTVRRLSGQNLSVYFEISL